VSFRVRLWPRRWLEAVGERDQRLDTIRAILKEGKVFKQGRKGDRERHRISVPKNSGYTRLMRNLFGFLFAALATAGQAQLTTSVRVDATNYFAFDNGPTNHGLIIYNRSITGTLRPYPLYNDTPLPGYLTGELVTINLRDDKWTFGTDAINLPSNTSAVNVVVKLKSVVTDGTLAAWNSLPAYTQADATLGRPSVLASVMSRDTNTDYFQNHMAHAETQLWVPVGTSERRVTFTSAVVPIEKNADGKPTIGILWNFGMINKDFPTSGNARGEVEIAVYLSGYYTPQLVPVTKVGGR
jgi:hypothetical protein